MFYSFIIPVYNRPEEIAELLESLSRQTFRNFEALVIDDGSSEKSETVVASFNERLNISYFFKENTGQGFTRNFGFERAKGDFFIILDSDCILPEHYLEVVNRQLENVYLDAYGGPDRAHPSFTAVQKAINYSMTSLFTTGGIRGNKRHLGPYHPRSFNMGISRKVYESTGGFIISRLGEDIEFSIRIINQGFKTGFIEEAFVYHKRRTDLSRFFQPLQFFGQARINIYTLYKNELKAVHFFPAMFTLGQILLCLLGLFFFKVFLVFFFFNLAYALLIFTDSFFQNKNIKVAFLSIAAAYVQLIAYGTGFMREFWKRIILKKNHNIHQYPS